MEKRHINTYMGEHLPESALYVDEGHRLCPGCPDGKNVHALDRFKAHGRKPGFYTNLCHRCRVEDERHEDNVAEREAVNTLTKTLGQTLRRSVTRGPAFAEVLGFVTSPMGGPQGAFERIGRLHNRVIKKAMRRGASIKEVEVGVKCATSLIQSAALVERTKGNTVDLTGLTEEELRDILMEPARQLICSDGTFRRQLLSDPEIRRMLLADEGVQVLDMEAEDASET